MQRELKLIISAITKGAGDVKNFTGKVSQGFEKGRDAVNAYNKVAGNSAKVMSGLKSQVVGLVGAFAGFRALASVKTMLENAGQAAFNMTVSVAAANREFENVGSVKEWENTVRKLSDELVIYSDTALKGAISRTVDMTKRLGLSKEQMEEVIKRSADLGAGKTDLEGAIERVTAALRGEAESAEYLGLTLNENYVKAWYEANEVTEKAWKDLTDLEKAQVRYQVLLEQSEELQGRAAASASTFGGALKLINKEIDNAVTKNKNVTDAMNDLAEALRENASEIGDLVGKLVGAVAHVIEFAVEYRNMLLIVAGTAVAIKLVTSLTTAVQGLNAACAVLTGMGLIPFFKAMHVALTAVVAAAGLTIAQLTGLAAVFVLSANAVYRAAQELIGWKKAAAEAEKIEKRARREAERYKHVLEEENMARRKMLAAKVADNKATAKEIEEYRLRSKESMIYYGHKLAEAVAAGKSRKEIKALEAAFNAHRNAMHRAVDAGKRFEETQEKQASDAKCTKEQLEKLRDSVEAIGKSYADQRNKVADFYDIAIDKARRAAGTEEEATQEVLRLNEEKLQALLGMMEQERAEAVALIKEKVTNEGQAKAEIDALNRDLAEKKKGYYRDALKVLESALDRAIAKEEEYAEKVKKHLEEAARIEKDVAGRIRELRRSTMTETERYADREKEIEEKTARLKEALRDKEYKGAKELGESVISLYEQQFRAAEESGKSAASVQNEALRKIQEIGQLLVKAEEEQAAAAERKRQQYADTIEEYKQKLGELETKLTKLSEMEIRPKLEVQHNIDQVEAQLRQLDGKVTRSKHIIQVVQQEAKRLGGLARLARGGKLPGWGGGDIIRALLEPGEFVVRKEAVKKYGAGLFEMLNQMRLNLPKMLSQSVPAVPMAAYAQGGLVARGGEIIEWRFSLDDGTQYPVRVVKQDKDLIRELESKLSRMRLTKN